MMILMNWLTYSIQQDKASNNFGRHFWSISVLLKGKLISCLTLDVIEHTCQKREGKNNPMHQKYSLVAFSPQKTRICIHTRFMHSCLPNQARPANHLFLYVPMVIFSTIFLLLPSFSEKWFWFVVGDAFSSFTTVDNFLNLAMVFG